MLASCATQQSQPVGQAPTSLVTEAESQSADAPTGSTTLESQPADASFTLLGRLAVQTDKRGLSGSLHWQHDRTQDHISLFSPLGSKVAEILSQPGLARLDTGEKSYSAQSPEALTQQVLGWTLPVSYLTEWVRGVPKGKVSQVGEDALGRSQGFDANGWQVRYQEYKMFSGQSLPSKLTLRSTDVYLKLVIDDWQLPEQASAEHAQETMPLEHIQPK